VALFLEPRHELSYQRLREYYPAAIFQDVRLGSRSPAIAFIAIVDQGIAEAIQGLDAQYYRGSPQAEDLLGMEQFANIDVDWRNKTLPILPLTVQWEGTLLVPAYGVYGLKLQDSVFTKVYLDEKSLILDQPDGQISLPLAQGNHHLRVTTEVRTAHQQTRLLWRQPQGEWEPVPREFLYVPPVTTRGLLGQYYANTSRTGPPTMARVDPSLAVYFHETPLRRPYSVEWTGTLLVPQSATYVLGLEAISRAQLFLDDDLVVDASRPNKLATASVPLAAGNHRIRVTYVDQDNYSHIYLYWGPEESKLEYVPPTALVPW
jgi:hypothetical protein